jgi:hypothetical protein
MTKKNVKNTFSTPSAFGSHTEMVAKEEIQKELNGNLPEDLDAVEFFIEHNKGMVLLQDEKGFYLTEAKHLDNKCADPYRYCTSRDERLRRFGLGRLVKTDEAIAA